VPISGAILRNFRLLSGAKFERLIGYLGKTRITQA
jgi:hypothetical protein